MQKLADVPDYKPEKKRGDIIPEECDNDLMTRFEIYLGQIMRVGRTRKRALRGQNDKSSGVGGNDSATRPISG
jgi:hypothetical protein